MKIGRYARRLGLLVYVFTEEKRSDVIFCIILDKKRKYFEFELPLQDDGDILKPLALHYKKIKKYVDMVHQSIESKRIKYCTKYNLIFKGY